VEMFVYLHDCTVELYQLEGNISCWITHAREVCNTADRGQKNVVQPPTK